MANYWDALSGCNRDRHSHRHVSIFCCRGLLRHPRSIWLASKNRNHNLAGADMTKENNGWLDRPGVPPKPEYRNWHWLYLYNGIPIPAYWNDHWLINGNHLKAEELSPKIKYWGECLTPPEVQNLRHDLDAKDHQIAELRQIIRHVAGCEHATASDEDLLEQVAAAICRINGIDPTGHVSINGSAYDWAWKHYLPQARAALGVSKNG